ncbi:hypothetical protein MEO40_23265 [Dolichospermum sp. ST_sed1]|nr:hypothetical protein [Dolichospermum sp. ST_sed1]MDD1425028.1 hypothetical protein [Dolichospermum sp. ST_sed9]MDD1431070.1 hypothetical protein [Dolichospermum sp. ST_sed6]MDD1438085.1 hypothetical protein [Dolichospermum sp. ST_sed10]MDD1440355.1 hypothetical protein [Dolichospermum sp. ST_sed3]MDD1449016.1 hypothetical protein [Dolichospermum sp. ST_sed8]MDD1457622.1 hypothetical protein [Dolichospermum sp. ST_sed7]MDD1467124.1 hypothetical protein [Dolichospermum sp. ST_sed5]MDD14741
MKILSRIFDNRINAYNILTEIDISEYLEIANFISKNNPLQRKRLKSYSSIYNLLKEDIKTGCTIPPIVLALSNDIEENIDIKNSDDDIIINYINCHKDKLIILDGLQRTHLLIDIDQDLRSKNNIDALNKFYKHKLRFEIYLGIEKIGILYRMLTLNTGQSPMSIRHQIEILYSDYLDESISSEIKLLKEVDEASPHEIGEYRFEYRFNDVIDGFTSYLLRDEASLDRRDLLEIIKSLENLAQENQNKDLFKSYLVTYNEFVKKIRELSCDWKFNDKQIRLSGKPFGYTVDKIFTKSELMTGFGAAVGFLKDKDLIHSFDDINQKITQIHLSNNDQSFLDELILTLDHISKTARKIGNSQRMYFYYFFRELFSSESDSCLSIDKSIESSFRKYRSNEL